MQINSALQTPSNEPLFVTLRSFPRPVWILFAGIFLNKFGTFVVPFLTLYLTRRGFTTADAGLAIGAYGLGRLGAAFIGGHLADTIGRRKTIVFSMVLAAVCMLLLSQARSLTAIVFLTGLASLTGELYLPACGALLADLVPEHRRVTAYSAYRMAFNAGWAFGPATAAFLASHSFLWLFVGDALTSLLFGVVAWCWLPRRVRSVRDEARWNEAWSVLKRDRRIHQVALATLFIGLVINQLISTYGLHVTALGFSDAAYGALLSLNGALVVLFELPLTTRSRRFPARTVIAIGYLLMGTAMVLNAAWHSLGALVVGIIVFTVGEMIFAPVAGAYVSSLAPPRMRGRYMGAWGFSNSLSLMLAPSLGLMVFARSPVALWLGCGALALLAAMTIGTERGQREPVLALKKLKAEV
jgi:MFS family permease